MTDKTEADQPGVLFFPMRHIRNAPTVRAALMKIGATAKRADELLAEAAIDRTGMTVMLDDCFALGPSSSLVRPGVQLRPSGKAGIYAVHLAFPARSKAVVMQMIEALRSMQGGTWSSCRMTAFKAPIQ